MSKRVNSKAELDEERIKSGMVIVAKFSFVVYKEVLSVEISLCLA